MACMLFDDRRKIHPFYAQAEKYPEYDGTLQQTYGVAEMHSLPTYRIGTPKLELIKAMKIIRDAGGRIQKKKMAEEAEKSKIITVNAMKQNFTQARFASLDKNIVQPLVDTWRFVEVEKIGVRPGEKFHEVLMSSDEARYSWDLGNKIMVANTSKNDDEILHAYSNKIKKNTDVQAYSSEYVEKLTVDEIKKLVQEYSNS